MLKAIFGNGRRSGGLVGAKYGALGFVSAFLEAGEKVVVGAAVGKVGVYLDWGLEEPKNELSPPRRRLRGDDGDSFGQPLSM